MLKDVSTGIRSRDQVSCGKCKTYNGDGTEKGGGFHYRACNPDVRRRGKKEE
jgi:hypothetical protein